MSHTSSYNEKKQAETWSSGFTTLILKVIFALLLTALIAVRSSSPVSAEPGLNTLSLNIPFKTFGGSQLWADSYMHAGWRIQRNVITGHTRLLDPEDVRRAWGSFESCKTVFEKVRQKNQITPVSSHLVLMVHGIAPRPGTFTKMKRALDEVGYDATLVSYPSTRDTIEIHAAGLEQLLDQLEGTIKISFVTHSMGGLVVRHLLHRDGAWKKRIEVGYIVQIAPPHLGSMVAEWAANLKPYEWTLGKSGQQLTPVAASGIPLLKFPFAIIAGGKNDGEGYNPFLPGDDDGVVRVAETRLFGMHDFLLIDATHRGLVSNPQAIKATINFLKSGSFAN